MLSLKTSKINNPNKHLYVPCAVVVHCAISVFAPYTTNNFYHNTIVATTHTSSFTLLHDRARKAAATAVIRADATALSALGLDNRTGGRGDG